MIFNLHNIQTLPPARNFILISFAVFLLISCERTSDPLPLETMSKILTEMYIAESYAQYVPKDSTKSEIKNQDSLKKFISSILLENKTNEIEFKQSVDWYKSRPELFDSIYQQVLTDLSIWQTLADRK